MGVTQREDNHQLGAWSGRTYPECRGATGLRGEAIPGGGSKQKCWWKGGGWGLQNRPEGLCGWREAQEGRTA